MKAAAAAQESEPPGASTGGDGLSVDPASIRTRKPAGLLHLCAELERRQAEIDRLSRDGADADAIDAALDAWWATVEAITRTPAKTPKAMRSKAGAVRMVLLAVGRDRSPEARALLASLLADLLGQPVELP